MIELELQWCLIKFFLIFMNQVILGPQKLISLQNIGPDNILTNRIGSVTPITKRLDMKLSIGVKVRFTFGLFIKKIKPNIFRYLIFQFNPNQKVLESKSTQNQIYSVQTFSVQSKLNFQLITNLNNEFNQITKIIKSKYLKSQHQQK